MSGQRYSVTIDVGADISSAKSAAQQLKNVFEGIGLGAGQSSKISGMFRDLDKALDEVAKRSSTALTSIGEVKGLDKAKERVVSIINAINSEFAKMGKLGDTDLAKNFGDLTRRVNDATKAIKTYNSTIGSLSKGHAAAKNRANELGQELAEQTKYYEQLQKIRDKFKGSSDKDISEALAKRQSTAKGLATRRQNELESFVKARGGRINVDKTVDKGWRKSFESKASAEDVETLNKLVTAAQSASNAFKTAQENYQNFSNAMSNFKGQKNFDELTKNAREAADELKKFESGTLSTEAFNKLKLALEQAFGPEVTAGIQNSATAVEEFQERINQISAKELDEFRKKVPEIDNLLNQLANTGEKMGEKVKKGTESFYNMKEAASDIDNLTYRLKYFFSLAGGFQLMRRAIRSVVSTTKELDAAMTQTAVVSTYTVKDMWKTLPQYSKEASKLGTAIKDVYNAQTLYVQQGLDMNTAMEIGVETMKMARVANIGAEEATNSMTAALRGFNMAIDEKSAKRVNDVYSKLAQNTASNTQEISTAMTKTAAIANSANMSFENTAAFLATIIESTREGAETAGTALKTVIARFTEVKKLYSQKELKGTDAEGQEIDVNKISAALRTAGINLNDFFTGSKGLDEILMQLGSKWNNLSTVQQRYIATMAAGSRQQSRFLALMQNYERTVSLTEMAYNSAGSGQEQFEKTLDSLDAKINQLKNSWDTFLMGLANSEAIKGTIDFATSFLDILNKIISALSGSSGLTKSLATLSMTMGAFRIGRSVLGKGGLLTSLLKGEGVGSRLGKTLVGEMVTSFRSSKTTQELKTSLGGSLTNSLKKNFMLFGHGQGTFLAHGAEWGGQYFSKNQLENIKAEVKNYREAREEIQKEVDEAQKEYDEAAYNSQGKSLSQYERQSIQEKQDRLNAAKQRQKDREKEYYDNQQKNGLSRQQATAAAENPDDIPKATINYKALANAALMAGAAITAVGVAMKNSGKFSDKAADSVTALGTALVTLGMAAKILQAIGRAIPALTTALTGPVGLAIAGVIAAVVAAVGLIDALTESSEEKQKRINETISKNQTHIQDLENEYKQVDDSLESIIEKQEGLDKLTEGTIAWKDAVKELNTEIQTLVQNFPDFLEAVTIDENGRWTIDTNKVREIQKNKKKEINATKQLNFAEEYVQQEEKIKGIEKSSQWLINGKRAEGKGFIGQLYSILDQVDYNKVSQDEMNKLVGYAQTHIFGGLEGIIQNFPWFKNLFKDEDLEQLAIGLKDRSLGDFAETFSAFKQISDIKKNRKTNLTSNVVSYLIDQLDEELPLERYGGAFRKFIYQKATKLAEQIEIKDLAPQEFEEYKEKYYLASGYYKKNGRWKDREGNNTPEVSKDEINTYAAIVQIFGKTDELIEYFKNNVNDFTLGKFSQKDYNEKFDELTTDLEKAIAKYYLDLFDEWNTLLKDINLDPSKYFQSLPANIVSQALPLVKDIKNTYGISKAQWAGALLEDIYTSIQESTNEHKEEIFQAILSDLESGVINTEEQLVERLKRDGVTFTNTQSRGYTKYIKLFKKKDTFQDLIDNFSEKYSFLDSIRSGKTTYTEEEKRALLSSGKFKESDFQGAGDDWEVIGKGSAVVAKIYSDYLTRLYNGSVEEIKTALEKKNDFKKIKEEVIKGTYKSDKKLTEALGGQVQEKINSFLAQDFSSLEEKDIQAILQYAFGYEEIYNPESGWTLPTSSIDKDVLTNTILPWLFEGNYTELIGQQTALQQISTMLSSAKGQLSSDTYSKLASYINGIRNKYGDNQGNQLLSKLLEWNEGTFFTDEGGTANNFSGFLDAIGKIDWSNINNLEQFKKALEDEGVVLKGATQELEQLYKTLESFYKISKILSIDDIKQLTSYGLQLKEEIKNKKDASYTQEQRDFLVAANGDLEDKFIYNAETGGYTYVGQKKELESAAQYGSTQNLWNRLAAQYALAQGPEAENYAEALKYLYGIEGTTKLTPDQEAEIEGFKTNKDYIKNQLELAAKMLPYAGKNNDQIREAGVVDSEIQKAAALQDAAKQGFSAETLQQYAQELSNIENLTEGMAYAIAYDAMLMNKGIDDLRTNFTSLSTVLQGIEKDENGNLKITTPEQLSALTDFNKIIKDITGTTKDFSSEFLTAENTLSLLQRILSGDTSALNEFRKAAAKDLIPKNLGVDQFNKLQSAIDKVDLSNVKIGDQIDEGIESTIDDLMSMGAIGIEQASAIYEALGFEPPEFEPQTIQYDAEMPTITTEDETASGKIGVSVPATPLTGESKAEGEVDVTIPAPVASTAGSRKEGSHARAKVGGSGINSKKGGGGGGGNKEFKNDFDKYYNQVEDINELERQRNLLEKDYNQLLKSENLSGKEIYDNLKAQIELLKERRFLVQDLAEKRKQQILDTMQDEQYKDVAKYSWWNEEDQTIEIDWQSIDKIKDSETGDLVKEYVKKLEDFQSKYDEQVNALEEIEDTLQEIKERGKEQYNTTEERLRDALIKQIQDKIDELTEVNEAINETNQKLFDSISETLELQRQERENAKTEEELTDKEKRLAYLQQDSSNANALEIAKLQEELADARENYTDTLIDQKISELQKQNEEAQEQRQEQIDLMQRSLEWQENSGAFWDTVYQYISEGTDAIGALIPGSNLVRLLKDGEAWDSLSEEMQMNWLKELETLVSEATGYLALNRQLEDIGTKEGTKIEFTTANGLILTGKVDKNGNVVVTNSNGSTSTYKDVYQDYYGAYKTLETKGELKEAPKPVTTTNSKGTEKPPTYTGSDERYTLGHNTVWSWPKKSSNGEYSSLQAAEAAARSANNSQAAILQAEVNYLDSINGPLSESQAKKLKGYKQLLTYRNTVGYATGGIADFTGPAWLDGTKSHPELVLNARDTQNFIELKDVLADMRKNGGLSLTGGDNYYNISVNVDQMSSDYDVDRAIDRIKARIAQDGAYRNVNTLSRLR